MAMEQGPEAEQARAAEPNREQVTRFTPSLYRQLPEHLAPHDLSAIDEALALTLNGLMIMAIAIQTARTQVERQTEASAEDDLLLGESLQDNYIDSLGMMVCAGEDMLETESPQFTPFHSMFEWSFFTSKSPSYKHHVERLRTVHTLKFETAHSRRPHLDKEVSTLGRAKIHEVDELIITTSKALFKVALRPAYLAYRRAYLPHTRDRPVVDGRYDGFPQHYFVRDILWRYARTIRDWTIYGGDESLYPPSMAQRSSENFAQWLHAVRRRVVDGSIWATSAPPAS